jgi:hypothetical protein
MSISEDITVTIQFYNNGKLSRQQISIDVENATFRNGSFFPLYEDEEYSFPVKIGSKQRTITIGKALALNPTPINRLDVQHQGHVERKEAFLHTFLITLWGVSENNVASIQSKLTTQFGSLQPIPARRPDRLVFAIQRDTWSLKDTAIMEALCDQHQISAWNQREAGLE